VKRKEKKKDKEWETGKREPVLPQNLPIDQRFLLSTEEEWRVSEPGR